MRLPSWPWSAGRWNGWRTWRAGPTAGSSPRRWRCTASPADEKLESFYGELGRAVRERRDLLRASGRALPGAQEAVAAVAALPGVVQSVVTGNTREIATEKLSALGLDEDLDPEVGGYGDDATDRAELVRRARERVERKYGVRLGWGSVVVVGDTEHDVAGAVDNGAAAVGVTSGSSDTEQLRGAGALSCWPT